MYRLAFAVLLALTTNTSLAHPSSATSVQHAVEHLALAMVIGLPALLLMRRWRRQRRLQPRLRSNRQRD